MLAEILAVIHFLRCAICFFNISFQISANTTLCISEFEYYNQNFSITHQGCMSKHENF